MCGRYEGENTETWKELFEIFDNFIPPAQPDLFGREMRPTNSYPILIKGKEGDYKVVNARWGLIPYFHRDKPIKDWKATTINARIEEVEGKASFKVPWVKRHCLVLASSFWEWKLENPEAPKSKQIKTRYCIRRGDNQNLVFAGLWDYAKTADGEVTSFTIVTRPAGKDMAFMHDREPVILDRDLWKPWVDCEPELDLKTSAPPGLLRPTIETRQYA